MVLLLALLVPFRRCTEVPCALQFDVKLRRSFLRKSKIEGLKPELFVVGGKVTIHSRQLDIVDYGDSYTRKRLEAMQQRHVPTPPFRRRCTLSHRW